MAIHFINITRDRFLEEYKRLYRFTSIERLVHGLDNELFTFVNPELWSDPYEKFYFKRRFIVDGKTQLMPAHNRLYAVCMSGTYESEAFWKVYAPEEDGVRVTISVRRLLEEFLDKITDADVYIGKVNYQTTRDFFVLPKQRSRLIDEFSTGRIGEEQLKLILKKRKAFAYENEIRIMVVPHEEQTNKKVMHLPLYYGDIVRDVTLDPRLNVHYVDLLKRFFREEYGFTVAHSRLFSDLSRGPLVLR